MANQQQHLIPFHQDNILAFTKDGQRLISVRTVCDTFKIDWSAQRKKLSTDSLFKSSVAVMTTEGLSGARREIFCLPLELFPMWLAKLNIERITSPVAKEKILLYQKEASKVLYEYFFKVTPPAEPAIETPRMHTTKIEVSQSEYIGLLKSKIELLELRRKPLAIKEKRPSRPITNADKALIIELHKKGHSQHEIGRITERSTATVHYTLKAVGLK